MQRKPGSPSGVTARRMKMNMTTTTTTRATDRSQALLAVLFVAVFGAALLFVAGHLQAATLHDAAHDVRHATGFPCH